MRLIGLCGRAGSGKTTVANKLMSRGFERKPFADPLKKMLAVVGVPHSCLWGDRKEEPLELLQGKSAREAMQLLGTEWGRNLLGPRLWSDLWKEDIRLSRPARVVVDDVRFLNEADAIYELGGIVVRVLRPGHGATTHTGHASEAGIPMSSVSFTLINQGTIEQLTSDADQLISDHFGITEAEIVEWM